MLTGLSWRATHEPTQLRLAEGHRKAIEQGRLDEAFELGEQLLDLQPYAESFELLLRPIEPGSPSLSSQQLYALLEQLESGSTHLPWRRFLRLVVLEILGWKERASNESDELVALPERYGWMRFNRGALFMTAHNAYEAAIAEFVAVTRSTPRLWKAEACRAECLLCLGRETEAFAVFDALLARLTELGQPQDVDSARVWRGEMHLWVGQYEAALRDLDEAAGKGIPHALVCRGGAWVQLGELDRALADLDAARAAAPGVSDALVWRGEVRAKQGRWAEARADFDRAVAMNGEHVWPYVGRALVMASTGDVAGFWPDYERLPGGVRRFFEWRLRTEVEGRLDPAVAVLEATVSGARGLRRSELYLMPLLFRLREGGGSAITPALRSGG